jgi:hypothetical protein
MMTKPLVWAVGLLALLTGCVSGPYPSRNRTVNTALTGACLVAQLAPCTIAASADAKASANEAHAASVRAAAQQKADAASKDTAQRSSCLTETGPRLPVQPSQCSAYAQPE